MDRSLSPPSWGHLSHRDPDKKATAQQSRVAGHSVPARVSALSLPPLRDVPSGLASGPRLQREQAFCTLWLKKDEPAVLPTLCGDEGGALPASTS